MDAASNASHCLCRERNSTRAICTLDLLGAFTLRVADIGVCVARSAQPLVALVALHQRADRRTLAGTLWPDHSEERATANLRAAVWRLPDHGGGILVAEHGTIGLDRRVDCDVHRLKRAAFDLVEHSTFQWTWVVDLLRLGEELLPDWDKEWLTLEREWLRQLRLGTLDIVTERLIAAGRCSEAVVVAMMAVRDDPLRESSQRLLIEAHQRNSNHNLARRQFETYRSLLRRELDIDPSFPAPGMSSPTTLRLTLA